jgi:hypothetical protein
VTRIGWGYTVHRSTVGLGQLVAKVDRRMRFCSGERAVWHFDRGQPFAFALTGFYLDGPYATGTELSRQIPYMTSLTGALPHRLERSVREADHLDRPRRAVLAQQGRLGARRRRLRHRERRRGRPHLALRGGDPGRAGPVERPRPRRHPHHFGATYLERAKTSVREGDLTVDQFLLPWFVLAGMARA